MIPEFQIFYSFLEIKSEEFKKKHVAKENIRRIKRIEFNRKPCDGRLESFLLPTRRKCFRLQYY